MLNLALLFFAEKPVRAFTFEYTVRSTGSRSGIVGYWDGNIGTISASTYTLPNGKTATVRQTMYGGSIGAQELRFLINAAGLGVGDIDQFPDRISARDNVGTTNFVLKSPPEIGAFGQGIGMDYVRTAGPTNPFGLNQDTFITLHYE